MYNNKFDNKMPDIYYSDIFAHDQFEYIGNYESKNMDQVINYAKIKTGNQRINHYEYFNDVTILCGYVPTLESFRKIVKKKIDKLKAKKIKNMDNLKSKSDGEIKLQIKFSESCAICLDKQHFGSVIKELSCKHKFHAKCINEWITHNSACPVCRTCCT